MISKLQLAAEINTQRTLVLALTQDYAEAKEAEAKATEHRARVASLLETAVQRLAGFEAAYRNYVAERDAEKQAARAARKSRVGVTGYDPWGPRQ
jgi:hypothetical protein